MISVIKTVICDDVRVEINGKRLIIGTYPGNGITSTKLPGIVTFSAYIELMADHVQKYEGQHVIEDREGKVIFTTALTFTTLANVVTPLHALHLTFAVEKEQTLKYKWALKDGATLEIADVTISLPKSARL